VHLNPVRAKLLKAEQPLSDFRWSSYPPYLAAASGRPVWLRVDRLFGEWGIPKDSAAGRRVFGQRMEGRRRQDAGREFKPLERGWYVGGVGSRGYLAWLLCQRRKSAGQGSGGRWRLER
jgi:hypothetical protein